MTDDRWAIIDWKTQNVKPGKEPNFYESWDLQLSAYRHAIEETVLRDAGIGWIDRRVSVVISTNPDNPGVWSKDWPGDSFETFCSALEVWKYLNNFDPTKEVSNE